MAAGYGVGQLGMGSTWGLLITSLVINSGAALAYGTMPTIIMGAVPRSETGAAKGPNTFMRSLGTACGAAIIGLVLDDMTIDFHGTVLPSETGFHTALWLGAGITLAAAVIAACIPAAKKPPRFDLKRQSRMPKPRNTW
ncbi:hypothetical protein GA0061084_2149 [Arthrobacter sp. NIO-1057]|nr:hypothetical protein GA0061084_2149 [Arthrobacter sp. NIO-1057]